MSLLTVITPNGKTTLSVRWGIVIGTILSALVFWSQAPASIPSLREVLSALPVLVDKGLFQDLYTSLTTNIQALVLSCMVSLPLAYLTTLPALKPLVTALCKTRFLGMVGFVMLFTLLFGGGHALKLALLVFGMSSFLLTSLFDIVANVPREEYDYARTLRLGPWGVLWEVVILGRLDAVLEAVRQNAAMGWVMLTMVEGLVRFEGGLGAMMLAEDKHIRLSAVFALQFVVLVVGIGQDYLLTVLRSVMCPYADRVTERNS